MKISTIQTSFKGLNGKSNVPQNQPVAQGNVSFSARIFTPQQLEKCHKVIDSAQNTSNIVTSASLASSFFTGGFGSLLLSGNFLIKHNMINKLSEVLNLGEHEIQKVTQKMDIAFINMKKIGKDFIKKASELD